MIEENNNNIIIDLIQHDKLDQAEILLKKMIANDPDNAEINYLLGTTYLRLKKLQLAHHYLFNAAEHLPANASILNNLGMVYHALGKLDEEIQCYRQALNSTSKMYDLNRNLINALIEKGIESWPEADELIENLLINDGNNANNLYLSSRLKYKKGDYNAAIQNIETVLNLDKNHLDSLFLLAQINYKNANFIEAIESYKKILNIDPEYCNAELNLGVVYSEIGRFDDAINIFKKIISKSPDHPEAHNNLGYIYTIFLDLRNGWNERNWRIKIKNNKLSINQNLLSVAPLWMGEDLRNSTILVHPEQGLGDEILYSSCLPDLVVDSNQVIIQCDLRLEAIYQRSFPKAIVHGGGRGETAEWLNDKIPDYQCPVETLSRFYRDRIEKFKDRNRFLLADIEKKEYWKTELEKINKKLKVGIVWRSGLRNKLRNSNYFEITELLPLLKNRQIQFINLVYADFSEEIEYLKTIHNINISTFSELDLKNDLDGSAALISALDLVIGISSAPLHLATALGVDVWMISKTNNYNIKLMSLFYPENLFITPDTNNLIGEVEKNLDTWINLNRVLKKYQYIKINNIEKIYKIYNRKINITLEPCRIRFQIACMNKIKSKKNEKYFLLNSCSDMQTLLKNRSSILIYFPWRPHDLIFYKNAIQNIINRVDSVIIFEFYLISRLLYIIKNIINVGWTIDSIYQSEIDEDRKYIVLTKSD